MAATGALRLISTKSRSILLNSVKLRAANTNQLRNATTLETGAVLPKPEQVRFGLIKVGLTVTPFLLSGAMISKNFAEWLEENELFVPEDDDDD